MPIASGPALPDNRHLTVTNLSRNDSLKSERSDKKVSFNNDVGVKHIPRGATKQQAHVASPKPPPDEWAECKPVKLQPNNLSAEELEKEAASLVDLVDSINCKASPLPSKKHKDYNSRSLDRTQKRNNNRNGQPNGINYSRITNPIIRHLKADESRRENRRREIYSDSDSDRRRTTRHKSVPNLLVASAYNNSPNPRLYNGIEPAVNYTSVDNLLDGKNTNIIHGGKEPRPLYNTTRHSADNLLDASPERPNLAGYRSVGNIPSVTDSDSTDMSNGYRPKVNQIIQRLNGDSELRYRSTDLSSDRDSSPTRGVIAPTRHHRHNNNKPFSYIEPKQVTSLQSVRNISPSRDLNSVDMYAQVNKHGLRQRLTMDSDYSAKIIITEDRPRNTYEGDDEAYETYQVQNNSLRNNRFSDYGVNLSRNDLNSKVTAMNNNINMSSVAVQTDTVTKALNKQRRPVKGMAPQPPVNSPFIDNNYRSRKDTSSELSSANLVRQVNHGFGRVDRSPSPPPRKAFNRSNPRHVIPLLSDTSDSEPEYRKRSDPLAKIRNQVFMEERLQEEHDAEQWEERETERYERDKRNMNYNPSGMRPLTTDEVDALSLELDQHGDRKLVVSQKIGEKRSTSQQISTHHSYTHESHAERSYSEDRSRPVKPLREKSQSNRDSSASRQMSVERNKKNNLEKEKLAQEKKSKELEKENEKKKETDTLKSKGKDKKTKDTKEKKKKRIKIKFFYDPKPQDKPAEDPLNRFTEYKGEVQKEQKERNTTTKTTRSRSHDSRSESRERKNEGEVSVDPRHTRDSSRERTLTRPDRSRKANTSIDRLQYNRNGSGHSSHDDSNDDRRRVRNTDSDDRQNRYNSRTEFDSREDRRPRYDYDNDDRYDRNRRNYDHHNDSRDNRDRKNDYNRKNDNGRDSYDRYDDYKEQKEKVELTERRNTFLERRDAYERRDSSVNRRDPQSLRKDSGGSDDRKDSYSYDRRNIYRNNETDKSSRNGNIHINNSSNYTNGEKGDDKYNTSPDEDGKQERVMRQRKKFLSALLSDGRAKSSNISSTAPPVSSPPGKNTNYSISTSNNVSGTSTVRRTHSTVHEEPEVERYNSAPDDKLGHESDPQPPPSVASVSTKPPASSNKKQTSTKKAKKKKKKKSWSWGFLGLRGTRRKKVGSASSRAGSERGGSSVGGGTPLKRGNHLLNHHSRPSSRASSHRSSTRPTRPAVRASKIRKDAGESRLWTSRVHDQRETRQWESATLQRPVGGGSRDRGGHISDDRRSGGRDIDTRPPVRQTNNTASNNLRSGGAGLRTSDGSTGSSAGPQSQSRPSGERVEGTTSFKQRYFGDSDNEPPRPRNSGPGDYRSLPTRTTRTTNNNRRGGRGRVGGGGGGSAGSSLQSSESENDSHQGSRASHVSTGSNRSVYLHATAVADIPVQKGEESDRSGVQRQSKKVTRSFSLLAPWKPRHAREVQNIDYDSREPRHAAKPPRPPRRTNDNVNRSQTLTNKDSKLSGWLKKRKNREGKGI
uniref:Histone-lysine N-methyltransferase, H3 lysine-79 specific-like n=1 Tax=Hirondellea gigas TaxID=1518452 RepID=A0A2P2I8U4_9CRUS